MTSRLTQLCIDGHDTRRLADFWCAVLDYKIIDEEQGFVEIVPRDYPDEWNDATTGDWKARVRSAPPAPSIFFAPVADDKVAKNRLHIDVCPLGDQAEEVERLLALGATKADVGQGADVPWVVMRDPEGNEFCVLSSVQA